MAATDTKPDLLLAKGCKIRPDGSTKSKPGPFAWNLDYTVDDDDNCDDNIMV